MSFTKINAAGIGSTETITVNGLTVVGEGSFGGNVSVAGTLTYEDVTNIDSVGLITARDGISVTGGGIAVGSNLTLSAGGNIFSAGISTIGNVEDGKGNLRSIPQNSQSSAYTLTIADAGKHVSITTGGITIPSGVFSTGDAITIVNDSGSDQTITCSAVTTYLANDTSTKSSLTLKSKRISNLLIRFCDCRLWCWSWIRIMPIQQMLLATGSSSVNLSDNYWMLNYTEGQTTYSMQEGNGVAVDNTDGSVYVCGYHIANPSGTTTEDTIIAKFDITGVLQWQRKLDSGTGSYNNSRGKSLAVDSSGNVYICGHAVSSSGIGNVDAFLVKFNSSGVLQWERLLGSSGES